MSDVDPVIVRQLRDRAGELRRIAEQLGHQADMLERQISDRPLIGGRMLTDAVVRILADFAEGLHYTTLLDVIERGGVRVRGVDPAATLLASIDRDPRIVSVRPRSGCYQLAEAR